jgi:hypothetical protein
MKWLKFGIFTFLALICFILAGGTNVGLQIAVIIFAVLAIIFAAILYYKNVSLVIIKRLLQEANVVVIILLTILNWIIEIGRPMNALSPIMGFIYMALINAFLFMDAVKLKSRMFVIIVGSLFTVLDIYNIYGNTFGNWNKGIVLFHYTIQGEEYTIMKRSIQRSIFLQVLLFSISAVYTMFKDKKMELMIFATGNIYRETGTAFAQTKNMYPPTREEYNDLINKLKLFEQNNKQNKNDDTTHKTTKEKKKASTFTNVDVELKSIPKDNRKNISRNRNTWAEIYHDNTVRRKSMRLLGEDVVMDDWLDWRVKWGQRGVGIFAFLALICHILAGGTNVGLRIAVIIFLAIALLCIGILYYKNISLVIIKRLLQETNVVGIILLTILNWIIEIERPMNSLSPIMGFIYMLIMNAFLFMDVVKLKSRILVIIIGSFSTILNIYNIYGNTFGNWNEGIVLFHYTIQGEEYTIMKRSTQRSLFLQVLLFSISAVYTMFKDKKMELMIFATGNIYRETGTASKEIEDKTFSFKIRQERTRSMDQSNQQSNSRKNEIQSVQNPLHKYKY